MMHKIKLVLKNLIQLIWYAMCRLKFHITEKLRIITFCRHTLS